MNPDLIQERWTEIASQIRTKWVRLSHSDIKSLNRNLDALVGKLRLIYGYTREHAERDYHEFRVSLKPLLKPR